MKKRSKPEVRFPQELLVRCESDPNGKWYAASKHLEDLDLSDSPAVAIYTLSQVMRGRTRSILEEI